MKKTTSRHYIKKQNIQMVNKHEKKCSVVRKYTQNYSETITEHPSDELKLERLTVPTVGKNMEHHALLVEV